MVTMATWEVQLKLLWCHQSPMLPLFSSFLGSNASFDFKKNPPTSHQDPYLSVTKTNLTSELEQGYLDRAAFLIHFLLVSQASSYFCWEWESTFTVISYCVS